MKNISLILNGVLLVAVIGLYVLFFTSNKENSKPASSEAPVELNVSSGIVYINIDSIVGSYDMNFDLQKDLENKLKSSEIQLSSKERNLQKKVEDYQYKAQKGLVTRSEAQQIEQGLMQEQQALVQLQNELRMQLGEEQQVAYNKVLNSIIDYLKSLEGKQNYQFVLGTSFGGNVLYANENLDITKAVVQGLNTTYRQSKVSTK